jgi:hypothetical protein
METDLFHTYFVSHILRKKLGGKVRVDGAELAEGATEIMEKFVTEKETYGY